ncbi:SATL1 [Symbiodinium necroappetens]|uniref:SATL1 protein n=1 Tax=Symbiodinium necroappetens TaxID=1628268 RepID=A0A812IY23_9DINO|nr:SATL1 [Symbiodinium necroappetens]
MSASSPSTLTAALVNQHIEDVLQEVNPILQGRKGLLLQPVSDWSAFLPEVHMDTPWYFGLLAESSGGPGARREALLSFYVGYSTWDGRCLFLDQLPEGDEDTEKLYLQILARIALRIGSRRLTWKRRSIPEWYKTGPPEISEGLLVLRMDRPAMESYAGRQPRDLAGGKAFHRAFVTEQVEECLAERRSARPNLHVRLVDSTDSDAEVMAQLVRGLAIYTQEPLEAVRCTARDYLVDGGGPTPLYYCLLIDHIDSSTGEKTTCGIAVVYFGYYMKEGRFLYLEDLYVEEAYRSKGAGSTTLRALADIGLRLDCAAFYWLALEWNKPALEMYTKIAEVQEGLQVHRYTDEKLAEFAEGLLV